MNAPPYIDFLGNSPGGNKISGKFPGPVFPDLVRIKNTLDNNPLRGSSNVWMTTDKYTSLNKTLVLQKAGLPDQDVAYDNNGMPVINDAEGNGLTATVVGTEVRFSWIITKEISVTVYTVDRRKAADDPLSDASYTLGVGVDFPDSRAVPKPYPDPALGAVISEPLPVADNYIYRLRARFENGNFKILQDNVALNIP